MAEVVAGATGPQLSLSIKTFGLVTMLLMSRLAFPILVRVTVCGALFVFTNCSGKVKELLPRQMPGPFDWGFNTVTVPEPKLVT